MAGARARPFGNAPQGLFINANNLRAQAGASRGQMFRDLGRTALGTADAIMGDRMAAERNEIFRDREANRHEEAERRIKLGENQHAFIVGKGAIDHLSKQEQSLRSAIEDVSFAHRNGMEVPKAIEARAIRAAKELPGVQAKIRAKTMEVYGVDPGSGKIVSPDAYVAADMMSTAQQRAGPGYDLDLRAQAEALKAEIDIDRKKMTAARSGVRKSMYERMIRQKQNRIGGINTELRRREEQRKIKQAEEKAAARQEQEAKERASQAPELAKSLKAQGIPDDVIKTEMRRFMAGGVTEAGIRASAGQALQQRQRQREARTRRANSQRVWDSAARILNLYRPTDRADYGGGEFMEGGNLEPRPGEEALYERIAQLAKEASMPGGRTMASVEAELRDIREQRKLEQTSALRLSEDQIKKKEKVEAKVRQDEGDHNKAVKDGQRIIKDVLSMDEFQPVQPDDPDVQPSMTPLQKKQAGDRAFGDWLDQNPSATEAEKNAMIRSIQRAIPMTPAEFKAAQEEEAKQMQQSGAQAPFVRHPL